MTNKLFNHIPLLITYIIQIISLAILIYCSSGYQLKIYLYFFTSVILIDIVLSSKNNIFKFVALFECIIVLLQLTNFFFTGNMIVTETLLNLDQYNALGKNTLIKAILLLLFSFTLFIPCIIFSKFSINKRYLLFIVILTLFTKPIYNFGKHFYEAIKISNYNYSSEFKESFYHSSIEFGNPLIDGKDNNLIIIFTEGTSFDVLSDKLTPNTINLMNKSLSFQNYYNHTAATYRGIRGQLISGYQIHRVNVLKTISLIDILNFNKYDSFIISAHNKKTSDFSTTYPRLIGFKNIIAPDNFENDYDDKTTYEKLFDTVARCQKEGKKYVICAYIFGTHEGLDSPHIKYGNGSNEYLNKFHNQDYWFGNFLKKMEKEDYLKDTILVFTADHSTYTSSKVKKTFNIINNHYIDRIPLFILKKNCIPIKIDVNGRNSLGLAPTILNILQINHENYFLGNSLFIKKTSPFEYISNIGLHFYLTKDSKVIKTKPSNDIIRRIEEFFKSFG